MIYVLPFSLTWQGHDFLDAIRNDTVRENTKDTLKGIGGAAPVELIKALALSTARAMLGLS